MSCQKGISGFSIFDYLTDQSYFINKNECNDFTPPFLTYIPTGILNQNVDIDSDLKGINRPNSKCKECKYHKTNNINTFIKQECKSVIRPYGYLYAKKN